MTPCTAVSRFFALLLAAPACAEPPAGLAQETDTAGTSDDATSAGDDGPTQDGSTGSSATQATASTNTSASTSTSPSTSDDDESSSSGDPCSPGASGCSCDRGACDEGLLCVDDVCAPPSCGDAILSDGEACDDGNVADHDGCNDDCTLPATLLWEYTIVGGYIDDFRADVAVNDDDVIAIATTAFVQSLDIDGNESWAFDVSTFDYESRIAVAPDGGFLVGSEGAFESSASRASADGELLWTAVLDYGTDAWAVVGPVETADGTVFALATRGDGVIESVQLYRIADGTIVDVREIPATSEVEYRGTALALDGAERLLVGYLASGIGISDAHVARWPIAGGTDWDTLVSGSEPRNLVAWSDDAIFEFRSNGVATIDGGGQELDAFYYAYPGSTTRVADGAVDGAGNFVLVGHYFFGGADFDAFVAKLDPAGELVWELEYEGPTEGFIYDEDRFDAVAIDSHDRILVAGTNDVADVVVRRLAP